MTEDEQNSEQGRWFLAWWKLLPTNLFTGKSKGSREEAWREWKKLNPDRKLCAEIGQYTKDKEAVCQQMVGGGQRIPPWKQGVRLLRYRYWDDELPQLKAERQSCYVDTCECGQPVDHGGHRCCWSCYDKKFGDTLTAHGGAA